VLGHVNGIVIGLILLLGLTALAVAIARAEQRHGGRPVHHDGGGSPGFALDGGDADGGGDGGSGDGGGGGGD
jgi:hypothetical protein